MKIILNNAAVQFAAEQLTVTQLLDEMRYSFPMIVIKVNGALVKKEHYDAVTITEGDKVEALHLISGG